MRLECALIVPAISELNNLNKLMSSFKVRADEMAPTMRFLVSVCTNKKYIQSVRPVLACLDDRYDKYAEKIAQKLECDKAEVEPYVYMLITSISNYMIFVDDVFVTPQMRIADEKFSELITRKFQTKGR